MLKKSNEMERVQPQETENLTTSDLAAAHREEPSPESESPIFQPPRAADSRRFTSKNEAATAAVPSREEISSLFLPDQARDLRARWDGIQVGFVDEPRRAVEQADGLVAETMKRLAEIFAKERETLEHQWDRGGDVSTEDLRVALRRYRSFFGRLLAV